MEANAEQIPNWTQDLRVLRGDSNFILDNTLKSIHSKRGFNLNFVIL